MCTVLSAGIPCVCWFFPWLLTDCIYILDFSASFVEHSLVFARKNMYCYFLIHSYKRLLSSSFKIETDIWEGIISNHFKILQFLISNKLNNKKLGEVASITCNTPSPSWKLLFNLFSIIDEGMKTCAKDYILRGLTNNKQDEVNGKKSIQKVGIICNFFFVQCRA